MWQSYSNSARTVVSDLFTVSGSIVYMKGDNLQKSKSHTAKYYDSGNNLLRVEEGISDSGGVFLSLIQPSMFQAAAPGLWKVELYRGVPLVATDTFIVQASAIPEIGDLSCLVILITCGVIYKLWQRSLHNGESPIPS